MPIERERGGGERERERERERRRRRRRRRRRKRRKRRREEFPPPPSYAHLCTCIRGMEEGRNFLLFSLTCTQANVSKREGRGVMRREEEEERSQWCVITCNYTLNSYPIEFTFMLILCEYDSCYHCFYEFSPLVCHFTKVHIYA